MKNVSDLAAHAMVLALVVGAGASAFACTKAAPSAHAERDDDPMRCASCHTPEFTATTRPPHPGARPMACGACHTQRSWGGWRVSHPWWELTGAHAIAAEDKALAGNEKQVKCFWCHRGDASTWKGTKTDCLSCHADDRATSKFPGHDTFPDTCEDCHSTTAWKPTTKTIIPPKPDQPDAGAIAEPADAAIADAAIADAAIVDAAHHAARPRPVYIPRPIPTGSAPPRPSAIPTTPRPIPTTPPDIVTHPSRHR